MPAFATGMTAALLNQLFASLHTRAKLRFFGEAHVLDGL